MKLYNTLSGQKEELQKPAGRPLKLFVCGPTVYDLSHIGHARTYVFFDAFVRYLRFRGWDVSYLQNITDVDDRIINRAKEQGGSPMALAGRFADAYMKDMRALGISSGTRYAFASRFIPDIVRQVRTLMQKGFGYVIDGDGIYYDISKFADYGALSHRTALQAEDSVSRIDESVQKRNKGDFCLWKFPRSPVRTHFYKRFLVTRDGEPVWRTSLGWGRPGWHIEDTAITERFYGPQYDVHGGGVDIKFPHHEAEIAQQEAASGKKPFVRVWMHVGSLLIEGKKMSKSLGNFVTVRDFLKDHPADVLRYLVLSSHYRSPMDYSADAALAAEAALKNLIAFIKKLEFVGNGDRKDTMPDKVSDHIELSRQGIQEAMEDDLNTPAALGNIFALIGSYQPFLWSLGSREAGRIAGYLREILGLFGFSVPKSEPVPSRILGLAEKRELSRRNKQFEQSDALRKEVNALGYSIEDTPLGPFVHKESRIQNRE